MFQSSFLRPFDKMEVLEGMSGFCVGDGTCSGAPPCIGREAIGSDVKVCVARDKGCRGGRVLTGASYNEVGSLAGEDVITVLYGVLVVWFYEGDDRMARCGHLCGVYPQRWQVHIGC